VRGEDTLAGWGGGGQYFGRARHCSVLCISKYFVVGAIPCCPALLLIPTATQYAYSTIPERGSRYTGTPDKQGEGLRGSVGAGNRQDRESEVADAGTGGKQVEEQEEFQEQEVSRHRNRQSFRKEQEVGMYRNRRSFRKRR
jgi:hypothetical protein